MNNAIVTLARKVSEIVVESESIAVEEIKPYPGLRPFEYKERFLFFGREGKAQEIANRLVENHFVAVVGTSGSGKSSLVRAGLLPLLYGGKIYELGSHWRIALLRPGKAPIHNLADALVYPTDFDEPENNCLPKDATQIGIVEGTLRRSGVGLIDFFNNPANNFVPEQENLLVIVDQFEELFRFKESSRLEDTDEAAAFVKLLLEATRDKQNRIYVVITMRSDFLGDCAEFRDLPEAINKGQYLIPRMTREQLRQSIESPAWVADAEISPALVNRLLNDLDDDQNQSADVRERMLRDRLPVLQHALMRTWDLWKNQGSRGEPVDVSHYEKTGGMSHALSNHADEAYAELSTERERKIAEKIFKSLTVTDSENRVTRRPVSLEELCLIADAEAKQVTSVIDVFRREGRTFLMPPPDVTLDEKSVVDISHESLIRKWARLKKWVEEELKAARYYRRLAEDAFLHYKEGEDLLSGSDLKKATKWTDDFAPNETWAQLYYRIWGQQSVASYAETIQYLEDSKNELIERSKNRQENVIHEWLERDEVRLNEQVERERKELREQTKVLSLTEDQRAEKKSLTAWLDEKILDIEGEIRKQNEYLNSIREQKAQITKSSAPEIKPKGKIEDSYISQAKDILRGKATAPEEILIHAKKLKVIKAFNYARRLLARAADDSKLSHDKKLQLRIYQEWALCTYKDTDLPTDMALDKALDILHQVEDLDTTKNQETLGLVGAIYKRKWEVDNQKQHLERALLYYTRGYQEGAANDQGYTAINAAFILDLLAFQEDQDARKARAVSTTAPERHAEARLIREEIVQTVAPLADNSETGWLAGEWWFYSTVAEAHFGLKEYEKAVWWLKSGREKVGAIPDWEVESTVRQLARLAIIQSDSGFSLEKFEATPAWNALQEYFGDDTNAVRTAFIGKIGLALSGGGFRAALYHIGTLAKLAELDVLRHVEVLSCVSGGAIIGAHYYLEVRKLLQSKPDSEITKQDYVEIVRRLEKDFLAGVQRNIRVSVAANLLTNLKMLLPGYSRSMRAGELYEKEIFSRVQDNEGTSPRYLNRLNIYPQGEPENFTPKLHNWRRAAKAPILILNATSLNTGHNWQFTTTWMGEPPSSIDTEVDTNDQLRRMYYSEAPEKHRQVRLGHAVSASACVPGIFEPLSLENLYPERIVRLVDGGVCDNQGLSSLLEQDCSVVLVSDGSGQMETENIPSSGIIGVPLRSNSILQSRIRDAQYHDLERRKRSSLLRGLMFIHLKQDLDTDPVDWVDCLDPFANSIDARPAARQGILTNYGISKELQADLAAVRTDLDSFTDIEAYTLMTSAYRMTENAFKNQKCVDGFPEQNDPVDWTFLRVEEGMKGTGKKFQYVKKLLETSSSIAFKIWKQVPALKYSAMLAGASLIAFIIGLFVYFSGESVAINVGSAGKWIGTAIILALIPYLFRIVLRWFKVKEFDVKQNKLAERVTKIVRWKSTLYQVSLAIIMCFFGWWLALIHLWVFDRKFLKRGSLDSFHKQDNSKPTVILD